MVRGGARAARAVALSISIASATLVLLLTLAPSATSAQEDDCSPLSVPPCTSTTETLTATTFIEETTTSTKSPTTTTTRQITTTSNPAAQAPRQATTTTTADAVPSVNLLIPGDGTEGAESTTTTMISTLRASDGGLDDSTLIALVIMGLVLIAGVVAVLTWRYWVVTRPRRRGTDAASASAG